MKDQWHGTLVLIGQPSEETIDGARAMLATVCTRAFPSLTMPSPARQLRARNRKIAYTPGYALASSTPSIHHSRPRAHGSRPEVSKDPIVLAAEFIMAIQTIVSRENSPFDPASPSAPSTATKYNIIPDDVHLQLTIRTYKEEVPSTSSPPRPHRPKRRTRWRRARRSRPRRRSQ